MSAVIAIAIATLVGIPIAFAFDPDLRGVAVPALGFLYGAGVVYAVMLAMASLGIQWTVWRVGIVVLIAAVAVAARSMRRTHLAVAPDRPGAATLIDVLTLCTLVTYVLYATVAPVWQWDFWMIWGLKGRVFFDAGTIDWRFLQSRWNDACRPDYPLLLPLNYTWTAMLHGSWDDRWLGLFSVAFGASTALIVRRLAAKEVAPVPAAAIAFATTAFALTAHIGMAEAPMIAYGGAGLLYLRRAVLFDEDVSLRHAVVLLGLGANCKNEGVGLVVCAAISLVLLGRHLLRRFALSALLVAPWAGLRVLHGLHDVLFRGSFVSRLLERSVEIPAIAMLLLRDLQDRAMWACILTGLLIVPAAYIRRERFVLLATALQLAMFLVIYLGTPLDVQVHIQTSWPRLPRQLAVPVLFIDLVMLVGFWRERRALRVESST